ncbi:MAG: transposase, partial [Azovibrio sp.]|uniref:transposase n=1 Tax=Azovibrio sp. TaxID=1872673 RepID=UPI003C771B53
TNGLERINREIKRRTRVASIFPNTASCLRLVSALLAECDEEWMTGKIYLNIKDRSHHPDDIASDDLQKKGCTTPPPPR